MLKRSSGRAVTSSAFLVVLFSWRHVRFLLAIVLAALLLLNTSISRVLAADGDLDPTFGNGGKITTAFSNYFDFTSSIAIQTDGKIVAAGTAGTDFGIARYNPDGSLDSTFGTGGKVTASFFQASAVVIQTDGKIVAVGHAATTKIEFALARYNQNGSLDSTFGTGGKVTTSFFRDDEAFAATIQPDGKIVVAGSSFTETSRDIALARYNTDGTLDATFGNGGKVTTDFFGNLDEAFGVALQSDGKIVVGGIARRTINGPLRYNDAFGVVRYNTDGSLDSTFGTGGKVATDFFDRNDDAFAMAIQSNGKIVVAGTAMQDTYNKFALARYNSDGSLDTTFGNGGKTVTDFGVFTSSQISDILIRPDGKIIAAGQSFDPATRLNFALARYNPDGSLDNSFGTAGKTTTDFFGQDDAAIAIAAQPDGKIVAAGYATTMTGLVFALARYNGVSFDVCLQDDSNANLLQFNSATGEYQFTNCSGFTLSGTGDLIKRGSIVTLQQYAGDRRVLARIDGGVNKATASIQAQGMTFSIIDRNTADDTCACTAH